jgi:cell division protein FtsB
MASKAPKKAKSILFGLGILAFLLALGIGREYTARLQVQYELTKLTEERDRLIERQAESIDLIDELSSEYYLERQAREVYGLAEPGERVIVLPSDHSARDYENPYEELSIPMKWMYKLFAPELFEEIVAYESQE